MSFTAVVSSVPGGVMGTAGTLSVVAPVQDASAREAQRQRNAEYSRTYRARQKAARKQRDEDTVAQAATMQLQREHIAHLQGNLLGANDERAGLPSCFGTGCCGKKGLPVSVSSHQCMQRGCRVVVFWAARELLEFVARQAQAGWLGASAWVRVDGTLNRQRSPRCTAVAFMC